MIRRLLALSLCALCAVCATVTAAPVIPSEPETWNVRIRYQIFVFGNQRLLQYAEMTKALKATGFERDTEEDVRDDEPENPKSTRMRGTVPYKRIEALLKERHVRSLLLSPKGSKMPEKGARVRIEVQLDSGFAPQVQRRRAAQTAAVLAKGAGFIEGVGYDHRGYTRLVGSVPVENLDRLLTDVRELPGAATAGQANAGIKPADVRATFVRPDWPIPDSMPVPPAVPTGQEKLTPDLRALLGNAALSTVPTRLEVILGWTPAPGDRDWKSVFNLPGVELEGRLGQLVTLVAAPQPTAGNLAAKPEVVTVRLPRSARAARTGPGPVSRDEAPAKWNPLNASGLARLHAMGLRGRGTRVALISDDFKGWEKLKNRKDGKQLLPDPVLVDLTAERRRDLLSDPFPSAGKDVAQGYGTRCAVALLKAAPEAELTLVRIDADSPHMIQTIAQAINGESVRTVSLDNRVRELEEDRANLEIRREELLVERRRVLDDFRIDPEPVKARKAYMEKQAAHDRDEKDLNARRQRYLDLTRAIRGLKGVRVVASSLVWTEGYPVDGSSALSRYFDDRPFSAALWFQAAGDTAGQAWTGLFRDDDGNGIMEFVDTKHPLKAGAWTRELNFLGWRSAGKIEPGLPAGTRIRLTLQWREPHDPIPLRQGEDVYREPLAKLKLVLVHQPDPDGKSRPSDDLQVVAQTVGVPQRLDQTLYAATWESVIDLALPKPGRYAVFVEGKLPPTMQAPGEVSLPGTMAFGELRLRLFVHTLAGTGRAVWSDHATKAAALGMPADARGVIAVGAADAGDGVRPSSASGPPFNLPLLVKPNVYAYDEGAGTPQAASFAAGLAASAWSSRGTLFGVLEGLRVRPGSVLRVPAADDKVKK